MVHELHVEYVFVVWYSVKHRENFYFLMSLYLTKYHALKT